MTLFWIHARPDHCITPNPTLTVSITAKKFPGETGVNFGRAKWKLKSPNTHWISPSRHYSLHFLSLKCTLKPPPSLSLSLSLCPFDNSEIPNMDIKDIARKLELSESEHVIRKAAELRRLCDIQFDCSVIGIVSLLTFIQRPIFLISDW